MTLQPHPDMKEENTGRDEKIPADARTAGTIRSLAFY